MATTTIQNQGFPSFRQSLNASLQGIDSCHIGATEPEELFAGMFWDDISTGLFKKRNTSNTGWIILGSLNADYLGLGARRNHIDGLIMTNSASDLNNDITFGVGEAIAGSRIAVNTTPMTKRLNSAWVAGTGQGGLFSGSKTLNTWYHAFIMLNTTTGAIDFGFDTTFAGSNAPSGWSVRRFAAIRTNAANNIAQFDQYGDWFFWKTPLLDVDDTVLGTTRKTYTIVSPPGVPTIVMANGFVFNGTAVARAYISNPNSTDLAPVGNASPLSSVSAASTTVSGNTQMQVLTNSNSQITARAGDTGTTFRFSSLGYKDNRGKE